MRAAEVNCAAEFIKKLPDRLDTHIGEKGLGLSEGQIQRLAVTRAILSDAPIILLDEATSALDEATEEKLLKKRLENLGGRRSCTLECRLADVQLSLAEYDRAEKTLEELTARWPQREAPWVLCLRLAAARRDGEAIRKTLGQIEEKEVYLSAKGREIVRFWQGKQQ